MKQKPASSRDASITDRARQLAYAIFYPWVARLEDVLGRKSDAAAIAVWHAGRLLVVEHSYKRGLTLPGGQLTNREQAAAAAVRELAEETGLVVPVSSIRFLRCITGRQTRLSLFECHLDYEPQISIDNREITAAYFVPPAEISNSTWGLRAYLRARSA